MRKIILNLAVSIDGFIEGPNGEIDWCIMEDDMGFDSFLAGIGTVLVKSCPSHITRHSDIEIFACYVLMVFFGMFCYLLVHSGANDGPSFSY